MKWRAREHFHTRSTIICGHIRLDAMQWFLDDLLLFFVSTEKTNRLHSLKYSLYVQRKWKPKRKIGCTQNGEQNRETQNTHTHETNGSEKYRNDKQRLRYVFVVVCVWVFVDV